MGQPIKSHAFASGILRVFLGACLVVSLAPAIAVADTTVGVAVERPAQVNETVVLGNDDAAGDPSAEGASEGNAANVDADAEKVPDSDNATTSSPDSNHIATDVPLGAIATKTLLLDGLTYEVDPDAGTAALVGWYGEAPKGDLSIPSQVSDGASTYTVTSVGQAAGESTDTSTGDSSKSNASVDSNNSSLSNSDTTPNSLGGGDFPPVFNSAR